MDRKKICIITAVPITATSFLRGHMSALSKSYSLHYVCNSPQTAGVPLECDAFYDLPIERGFSVGKDLKALRLLYKYFKAQKFASVHSVTPKAGLLTALAARLARIPVRIHVFTGQVWATRKGLARWLLKTIDKIIVRLDSHILVDGKSQRSFLEQEGVLKPGQATVFGDGSLGGIDTERFAPDATARRQFRQELGIKDDTLVYLFIGRLTRDKGIRELFEAFDSLAAEARDVYLLLVGWDEEDYASKMKQYGHINASNARYYGATPNPEKIINAGDVCVLPTYREGFSTSVLEAACAGLPCIVSDAYGALDISVDGVTGLRCKVGDAESLYQCMKYFNENRSEVKTMGENGRERVLKSFSQERLTGYWVDFYHSLLDN